MGQSCWTTSGSQSKIYWFPSMNPEMLPCIQGSHKRLCVQRPWSPLIRILQLCKKTTFVQSISSEKQSSWEKQPIFEKPLIWSKTRWGKDHKNVPLGQGWIKAMCPFIWTENYYRKDKYSNTESIGERKNTWESNYSIQTIPDQLCLEWILFSSIIVRTKVIVFTYMAWKLNMLACIVYM